MRTTPNIKLELVGLSSSRVAILLICLLGFLCNVSAADFTVVNANDAGSGSLRQAITSANVTPALDYIVFAIPGAGPHLINLSSALPSITAPISIDGYSQSGSSKNTRYEDFDGVLMIGIDGGSGGFPGLVLAPGSGGSTIQGLWMHSFNSASIRLLVGSDGNGLTGNILGMNATGTAAIGDGNGIEIFSKDNILGGPSRGDRSLISGNPSGPGILVSGIQAYDNLIQSNFIGLSADGITVVGGIDKGVLFEAGCHSNSIGGDNYVMSNYISGATGAGISIEGATTTRINVKGNSISQVGGIAIDLNGDGQSPNDVGDADSGPNGMANYPVILRAMTDEQYSVYAELQFDGVPNTSYRFDWYLVSSPHASGHGDALLWLGRCWESTDALGLMQRHFTFGRGEAIPTGSMITCTATLNSLGNTSELAQNYATVLGELEVTNVSDLVNGTTSSVIDLILSPGVDGISLREAILAANNTETTWGSDHIMFDILGPGPHIISPTSPLPAILTQVYMNGSTEPDYTSTTPAVVIDGSLAGADADGFDVQWDWCTFRNLAIVNFDGDGLVASEDDGEIHEMYIGVMPDGVTPGSNGGYGLQLIDSQDWYIGEDYLEPSIFSNNTLGGIRLRGSDCWGNRIVNAHIGTDVNGIMTLGGQANGITISNGAHDNIVGDGTEDGRNIISGNLENGVRLQNLTTAANQVIGNYIGTDITGINPIGNGDDGVNIDYANSNIIRDNVIGANQDQGVDISYVGAIDNVIQGNYIGIGADGFTEVPNNRDGIVVESGAARAIIGGSSVAERNIISANGANGIALTSGPDNVVLGNYIGTDISGTLDKGNSDAGIEISNAADNIIGGDGPNDGNVISGNSETGISVTGASSTGNQIRGNIIGLNAAGTASIANQSGISLVGNSTNTVVGGSVLGSGNLISGNGNSGVFIESGGNEVRGNVIGLNKAGDSAIPNGWQGVLIGGGSDNIIGGTSVLERNVISGNNSDGIRIQGTGIGGTRVIGNYIGTDPTGNGGIGNLQNGIGCLDLILENTIGTNGDGIDDALEGNLISGNNESGINLYNSSNAIISGNVFGQGADGSTALSNGNEAILIEGTSSDNTIGYSPTMANDDALLVGNKIVNGDKQAIQITGSGLRNRISRNSTADNKDLAIDLGGDLVTPNDDGDGDSGPNDLVNFPVIEKAILTGTQLRVSGYMTAAAEIEFFIADSGPSPNPLSYNESFGEGDEFKFSYTEGSIDDLDASSGSYSYDGTNMIVTRTQNRFEFNVDVSSLGIVHGSRLTATTIKTDNSTSEFSAVKSVVSVELCNNGIDDDGDGKIDELDPECMDCDQDGVTNAFDLDDDNDGLADLSETLSTSNISGTIGIGGSLSTSSYTLDGTTMNYTSNFIAGECQGYNAGAQGPALYISNTVNSFRLLRLDFVNDVSNLSFKVTDLDNTEEYDLEVYDESFVQYDLTKEGVVSLGSIVSQNATGRRFSGTTMGPDLDGDNPANDAIASVVYHFPGKVGTVIFNIRTNTGNSIRITELKFNVIDSDTDGVIDACDLDSDNDGIFDVIEAGGVDPDFDGVIGTGPITDTDGDGLSDIVDTDNGGTPLANSDFDSDGKTNVVDLDSDNDGCPDVIEAGFPDADGDQQLGGLVPPTVDSKGIVTSGGL